MKLNKVNNFFGTLIIAMGFLRFLEVAFVILNLFVKNETSDIVSWVSTPLNWLYIIIIPSSIIMTFFNMKEYPIVMGGYLLVLLAFFLELFFLGFLMLIYAFFESALYLKAGSMIREKDIVLFSKEKSEKEKMEKTDWFYGDNK